MSIESNKIKKELKEKAKVHVEYIKKSYRKEIMDSIKKTVITTKRTAVPNMQRNKKGKIHLRQCDVIDASLSELAEGNVCVLNFASFKNPGGGFMAGSMAQEEAICHATTLYPVLNKFSYTYYRVNNTIVNNGFYDDKLIYTPGIVVFNKDGEDTGKRVNCISCSAPNLSYTIAYGTIDWSKVRNTLIERARLVLDEAVRNNNQTIILGAWGCGVFRNDPVMVAEVFKELLDNEYANIFDLVLFAIPDDKHYKIFSEVLSKDDCSCLGVDYNCPFIV